MNETAKKLLRSSRITWLIIGGLVLIGIVFMCEMNRITLHHILYRMDFRHWPINLGIVFWLLFACIFIDVATASVFTANAPGRMARGISLKSIRNSYRP